jgi:hypothetical protein
MGTPLVDLPNKRTSRFLHPENKDLVLSLVASGFVFTFWNSINIRPSLLTDPGYQDQREGIERTMNLSLLVVLAMAGGLAAIYGRNGYVPSLLMAATGVGMYIWTAGELNHQDVRSDTVLSQQNQETQQLDTDASAVRINSSSVLYAPIQYYTARQHYTARALPPKRRKEHATM